MSAGAGRVTDICARNRHRHRRRKAGWVRRLVVMVKAPVAGAVKTRLARDVGAPHALRFYRACVAGMLSRVASDRRWITVLAVSPDGKRMGREWPRSLARIGQGGGDLGRRMDRIMHTPPKGPVVIVGSDIPGVRQADIASAFKALGARQGVCGPAPDGGYWLIGLKRFPRTPRAFDGVRWSTDRARSDTLAHFTPKEVVLLRELADVDGAEDLAALAGAASRRIPPR